MSTGGRLAEGFTKKYNVDKLVYYEYSTDVRAAIAREKQLKGWTRAKKNELIARMKPPAEDADGDTYNDNDGRRAHARTFGNNTKN